MNKFFIFSGICAIFTTIFAKQLTNNNVEALLEIQLRNDFLLGKKTIVNGL